MIEDEILQMLNAQGDGSFQLNNLADEFRLGRDPLELLGALRSGAPDVAAAAAWILGEIPFETYAASEVLAELWSLCRHPDPAVRITAFGGLYPALSADDDASVELVGRLLNDSNPGVRQSAVTAAARLGISTH